jgi:NAD(P)-dependent dehydrogenase (short-subunit alcohol dehydrogenase family)
MDHRSYAYPDDLLHDRIILISGASAGIGRALALHAAAHGAQIILHGRNVGKLEEVYDEIEAIEGAPRPSIAVMDLATADDNAYRTLAESLTEEFGRNVTATFALTQVCLPLLHCSKDASIIFTSSGVGRRGSPFWGAYAVSKFATEGLSQVLASEQQHGNLRVNCINPGPVRTEMRRAAYPAENRDALTGPEGIMPTYMYLLGPDSKGVTGESLDAQ